MAFDDTRGRRVVSFPALTSNNAATTAGIGTAHNLGAAYSRSSVEVVTSDTGWIVQLQGSLSGGSSSWQILATHAASSDSSGDLKSSTNAGLLGLPVTRVRSVIVSKSSDEALTSVIGIVQ